LLHTPHLGSGLYLHVTPSRTIYRNKIYISASLTCDKSLPPAPVIRTVPRRMDSADSFGAVNHGHVFAPGASACPFHELRAQGQAPAAARMLRWTHRARDASTAFHPNDNSSRFSRFEWAMRYSAHSPHSVERGAGSAAPWLDPAPA